MEIVMKGLREQEEGAEMIGKGIAEGTEIMGQLSPAQINTVPVFRENPSAPQNPTMGVFHGAQLSLLVLPPSLGCTTPPNPINVLRALNKLK